MRKVVCNIVFLFCVGVAHAQAPDNFFLTFGGSGEDAAYACKQTIEGDYIVAGSTSSFGDNSTDFYLYSINKMGFPQWQKTFGGAGNEVARGLVQMPDSGFVLVGYTSSFGAGGYDAWIVRTDKFGSKIWDKTFGGDNWDFATDIVIGSDAKLYIVGYTESFGSGGKDGFVLKMDADGNIIKSNYFGGVLDDELNAIIKTNDGKLACVGYTKSRGDASGDAYILKLDTNCDTLFTRIFGWNGRDFATDILQRPDNEYVICGGKTPSNSQYSHSWMYSINAAGDSLWENSYYASQKDEAFISVAQSGANLLNSCYVRNVPVPALGEQINIFLAKPEGWPVIVNSSGGNEDEYANVIEATSDGGFIVAGTTNSYGSKGNDAIFFKHDSTIIKYESLVGVPKVAEEVSAFTASYVDGKILLEGNSSDFPASVSVYNLNGQLLLEKKYLQQNQDVQFVSSFGMYIIEARPSQGDIIYQKLIVK